jgi:hypothetical protein
MSKTSKPPGSEKGTASVSPQLLEITETYLNRLLKAKETDKEAVEIINDFARELDQNQAMAEIFLKKILAAQGSFSPWFLPDLNQQVQSKPVKKGIKKALYLLKQKGIEPPSSTDQQKQEPGILKNIEPLQAVGYLSEFDGLKNQMVGLLIPKPAKGRLFVFALIGSFGLESLQAVEVSKREVRDILADLEKQAGHAFFQADFSHAAYVLQEAHDRQSKLSKEEEGIYAGILSFLTGKKMIGQSPIIRSLLDKSKPLPYSSDIQRLLQVPEIFYLLPEPGVMESYLRAVQEVRTSLLILNDIQKRERIRTIVDKAVQESFLPETRPGLVRYLEEVAYLYVLRKRPDEAEAIMYWAKTLEEEKEPRPGKGNPLLFWLMETVLLAQEAGKTPIEEQKEQTTPGGIILPSWVKTEEDSR